MDDSYKATLLPLLVKTSALTFGTYTLKSGRISPYFFNSSQLYTASLLGALARAYASVLVSPPFSLPLGTEEAGSAADGQFAPHFDILFGPAYKGIPICAVVTRELESQGHAFEGISYSFNRKEAKDHGEGGTIVGAPLKGKRVVVLDDVMTAGTALREAIAIIQAQGGIVVGVVLLLTRQERVSDTEPRSAMKVAEDELNVPVHAVLKFEDLIAAVHAGQLAGAGQDQLEQMTSYRESHSTRFTENLVPRQSLGELSETTCVHINRDITASWTVATQALQAPPVKIASHKKKLSLLGGTPDPSYQPLRGGYHQREGYAVNNYDEPKSRMYIPNSRWTWAFSLIALVQACIVLAFESYVFATFQLDLKPGATHDVHSRTIPTFLTLYIFGFVYQLVLVWDALRLKNTIQVIGLVIYNLGLLIYGAVQMDQIKESVLVLNSQGRIDLSIWADTKPYLIAVPIILAVGTVLLAVCAWKLYDEFAWVIYRHISADVALRRRYLIFQVYIALLKFDFFFFLGFTIQFVVIVTGRKTEFALTIAAIPVTIIILLAAAFFCRREWISGTILVLILYLGGLAYFIFKLVRMYSPEREAAYLPARKELTTFAVLTLILIIMTIVNCIMCAINYNKGLKPFVVRRKVQTQEEKQGPMTGSAYAPYATEMQPNPAGGYGMQGAAMGKMPPPRPMPARMEID